MSTSRNNESLWGIDRVNEPAIRKAIEISRARMTMHPWYETLLLPPVTVLEEPKFHLSWQINGTALDCKHR